MSGRLRLFTAGDSRIWHLTRAARDAAAARAEEAGALVGEATGIVAGAVQAGANAGAQAGAAAGGAAAAPLATAAGQSAGAAGQSAQQAEAARIQAAASAAAAAALLNPHPTIEAGLAATAEGAYFAVLEGPGTTLATLYRKMSGAAVAQGRLASMDAVEAVEARLRFDPSVTDALASFRTKSGKRLGFFDRAAEAWRFRGLLLGSLGVSTLTATGGSVGALSILSRLSVATGSFRAGLAGALFRIRSLSGKVAFDVTPSGVRAAGATITNLQASEIAATTATISTLNVATFNPTGRLNVPGGSLRSGLSGVVQRWRSVSGKVPFAVDAAGRARAAALRVAGDAYVGGDLVGPNGPVALPLAPPPPTQAGLTVEACTALNAQAPFNRPSDAEAPAAISVDHDTYGFEYNAQAPSVAVCRLQKGRRKRVWGAFYGQNNNPGGGAIGGGSIPFVTLAYCDNFDDAAPTFTRAFYLVPVLSVGDETTSDPELFILPDGRMLVTYITSNITPDRRRSTYGLIVNNPGAMAGAFEVGRQCWLGYGVASKPANFGGGEVHCVIDEWGVARRYSRIAFSASPNRDLVTATTISVIPQPNPDILIFQESWVTPVSAARVLAGRRTTDGLYLTLSDPGGLSWGSEVKFTDAGSANSRSHAARSLFSGRTVLAVNDVSNVIRRLNLTLCVSEEEGLPGTYAHKLNIEPDPGTEVVASQYPAVTQDDDGFDYCAYRWSDSRITTAPNNGILIARVREDLIVAGTATLADVKKATVSNVVLP